MNENILLLKKLTSLLISGHAAWKPFLRHKWQRNNVKMGEVCIRGILFVTELDEVGCPKITPAIAEALYR